MARIEGQDAAEARPTITVALGSASLQVVSDRPETNSFWRAAQAGGWEDDTLRFIDAVTGKPGATLVDIGAWIGPISLYASPRVTRVIALEPDPVAHRDLAANIAANAGNVEVLNAALDSKPGVLNLYAPAGFGGSVTSSYGEGEPISVPAITIADVEAKLSKGARVILKIDIEGHEFRILDDLMGFARRQRASTHFSLHPRAVWDDARRAGNWPKARLLAYQAAMRAITALSAVGPVILSDSGQPVSSAAVFRKIFLKRRPKNFSVEVREPS